MKIGILTFHRSINYGAFLQCYSLVSSLKEMKDVEVDVIDYQHLSVLKNEIINAVILRGGYNFSLFKEIKKYRTFRRVQKDYLPLTKKKIISDGINNNLNELIKSYDLIIIGSDEVWKISKDRKFPNIYWIAGEIGKNVISYAASANRTEFKKLKDFELAHISKSLKNMIYIGVRDQNTYQQIKDIMPHLNIQINCDPTFGYLFNNDKEVCKSIEKKLARHGIDLSKPLLGVTTGNKKLTRIIKDRFGEKYQIIGIGNSNKLADAYLYDFTPFEWARIFHYLDGCITGFFHATIFCIKNRTPFAAVDNEEHYVKYESKMKDLLKRNELSKYYYNAKMNTFNWNDMFNDLESRMNYRYDVGKKLENVEIKERGKYNSFNDYFIQNYSMSKGIRLENIN